MKISIISLAVVIVTFTLVGCKKDSTTFNSYFYTSMSGNEAQQLSLYIDNQYKGELPYLNSKPSACDNDPLKSKAFYMTLESGKYTITAKDKDGKIKSSCKLEVRSGLLEAEAREGGNGAESCNGCLVVELFY